MTTSAIEKLNELLGEEKVSQSPSVLEAHGRDENFPVVLPPLAVVFAERLDDVRATLEWCRLQRVPLIPFGAGTSLEGSLIPVPEYGPVLSLDLSRMNRVLSIQPENFLAVVGGRATTERRLALRPLVERC